MRKSVYTLRLEGDGGSDQEEKIRLKIAMKVLLRKFRFRCVGLREEIAESPLKERVRNG